MHNYPLGLVAITAVQTADPHNMIYVCYEYADGSAVWYSALNQVEVNPFHLPNYNIIGTIRTYPLK